MSSLVLENPVLERVRKADKSAVRKFNSLFCRHLPICGRYTAGLRFEDGARKARELEGLGMGSIVNVLGEHREKRKGVEEDVESLLYLVFLLKNSGLNQPSISLKPTQLGLMIDEEFCRQNMLKVMGAAVDAGLFVWADAESAATTNFAKRMAIEVAREFKGRTGIAVQANLKRSEGDVEEYCRVNEDEGLAMTLRLVRGIYRETPEIAYMKIPDMHTALAKLMELAGKRYGQSGLRIAVGSHHPDQIIRAIALHRANPGLVKDIEFLLGAVTTEPGIEGIPKILVDRANDPNKLDYYSVPQTTIYVPCGPEFYAYSIRRFRENPDAIFGFVGATRNEKKNLRRVKDYLVGRLRVDVTKPELPILEL